MTIRNAIAPSIVAALATRLEVTFDDLRSPERREPLALRRAEVMYVMAQLGMTPTEIGELLNRHYTTILSGIQRVEKRFETHAGYQNTIEGLVAVANGATKEVVAVSEEKFARRKLADLREGRTLHFTVLANRQVERFKDGVRIQENELYEVDGYLQTGTYEDGQLGEIFLKVGKQGDFHAVLDSWAIAFSIALQHGADVDGLCEKFTNANFEPSGAVSGVEGITRCTSVVDLVAKWLQKRYGKERR